MPALTNLVYSEFDSTMQTLTYDIGNALTASAAWSKISPTAILLTTSASSVAGATTLTFTAVSGVTTGMVIAIGAPGAADREYRTVTAQSATTLTVAAMTYAHPSGTNIYVGNEIYKATTTRGADMIVDFMDAHVTVTGSSLNMAVWRTHTGAVGGGTNKQNRYLWWRATAGTASAPLHVILSASKEHMFISIEGPRASETSPDSATLGSYRNYFFICDIVPYFVGDSVAAVFAGGQTLNQVNSSTMPSIIGHISRDWAGSQYWGQGRLVTLCTPGSAQVSSINVQRQTTGDGDYYMFPYVVASDADGLRGRLGQFFFAGFTQPDWTDTVITPPPAGTKVTIDGQTYKLLIMNKTATSASAWGQFGLTGNTSNSNVGLVVAVPST